MIDVEQNSSIFLKFLEFKFNQHNLSSHQPHLFIVIIPGKTLDLLRGSTWDRGMKATLIALFVSMFLVGCVRERITDYYDNGQKKYERTWKGQELDGPVTWWYENGQMRQQIKYKDGTKDGPFIVWNEKGKEIRRENYKDGEIVKD